MKLNKQSSQKFTFFLDSVTNHHTVRAGASLQQGAQVDPEADYGLQGAVEGRREVQAGEMLFFFVIWDSGRVLRSLWVMSRVS